MNTFDMALAPDPHFEALKSLTRLQWMLNFEAVATVADRKSALNTFAGSKARSS